MRADRDWRVKQREAAVGNTNSLLTGKGRHPLRHQPASAVNVTPPLGTAQIEVRDNVSPPRPREDETVSTINSCLLWRCAQLLSFPLADAHAFSFLAECQRASVGRFRTRLETIGRCFPGF